MGAADTTSQTITAAPALGSTCLTRSSYTETGCRVWGGRFQTPGQHMRGLGEPRIRSHMHSCVLTEASAATGLVKTVLEGLCTVGRPRHRWSLRLDAGHRERNRKPCSSPPARRPARCDPASRLSGEHFSRAADPTARSPKPPGSGDRGTGVCQGDPAAAPPSLSGSCSSTPRPLGDPTAAPPPCQSSLSHCTRVTVVSQTRTS